MGKRDPEYIRLNKCIERELDAYPNIRKLFEEKEIVILNKEEINTLFRIMDFETQRRDLENKELFFKGGRQAYDYFCKMGIIKELDKYNRPND